MGCASRQPATEAHRECSRCKSAGCQCTRCKMQDLSDLFWAIRDRVGLKHEGSLANEQSMDSKPKLHSPSITARVTLLGCGRSCLGWLYCPVAFAPSCGASMCRQRSPRFVRSSHCFLATATGDSKERIARNHPSRRLLGTCSCSFQPRHQQRLWCGHMLDFSICLPIDHACRDCLKCQHKLQILEFEANP